MGTQRKRKDHVRMNIHKAAYPQATERGFRRKQPALPVSWSWRSGPQSRGKTNLHEVAQSVVLCHDGLSRRSHPVSILTLNQYHLNSPSPTPDTILKTLLGQVTRCKLEFRNAQGPAESRSTQLYISAPHLMDGHTVMNCKCDLFSQQTQ